MQHPVRNYPIIKSNHIIQSSSNSITSNGITHYNSTDLSRIQFHLREDKTKYDLRILLDAEQQIQQESISNGNNINNNNNNNVNEDIKNAFHSHSQPNYNNYIDRRISGITNKLGPLNDSCIDYQYTETQYLSTASPPIVTPMPKPKQKPKPKPISTPSGTYFYAIKKTIDINIYIHIQFI